MTKYHSILDAHCSSAGSIIPTDPDYLRTWLLALAERAYLAGRRNHHIAGTKSLVPVRRYDSMGREIKKSA
jgi:hypothetical protein